MSPVRVVIVNPPQEIPRSLLSLPRYRSVTLATADAIANLRESVQRLQAQLVIVNLEFVSFAQLTDLRKEFPNVAFVCIHRLADDSIWAQSLAAGAVDCCFPSDLFRILENAERYLALNQMEAVSAA
jgi:hypothetical protein